MRAFANQSHLSGFCTPGFVMSIHSALQKFPAPSLHQLEKSIDGNLCRCTGYRPIVDALRYAAAACAQPTFVKSCSN